jgi:hypothetical protein
VNWRTGQSGVPPDSVRCTRTVQMSTSHSREFQGALHYNLPDCPVRHRTVRWAAGNGYLAATVDSAKCYSVAQCHAEVRATKYEATRLSGVAPDCPVPQEDKAPTVDSAPNPNGWVTWQYTEQGTVFVWWHTGLSGAPIASSLPTATKVVGGYKYPQPPQPLASKFFRDHIQYKS